MNGQQNIKVIELRNYLLKPKVRDKFAHYFKNHFVDSQNDLGGYVLGQFTVKADDNFFWIRGFENMKSRSRFLPEFYYGATWKEFGSAANEMMLDSDNVYLLKPLDESQAFRKDKVVKIDYYFAKDNQLERLIEFFQTKYLSFIEDSKIGNATFWRSELSENDFPKLPAFQYENLFVVITAVEDEENYQAKLREFDSAIAELNTELEKFIIKKDGLLLYEI